MRQINASIGTDKRLWQQDLAGSRAHVAMLGAQGIIAMADVTAILAGLNTIHAEYAANGVPEDIALEDIHMTVETRLGTITQDVAGAVELCQRVAGLGLTLDPSHYLCGPHPDASIEPLFPFVRHVRMRDSNRGPGGFQVRVGQGELEYSRVIASLERCHYDRALTVDIRDSADSPFPVDVEVRKLKFLLESLA